MIDGHIHIENQPYSIELINNMVKTAIEKGIDEINVLDHSHKFKEFSFLYSSLKDDYSISWYNKKNPISISNYLQFIEEVRKINFPVKINFGLEICYFEDKEDELMNVLSLLPKFDFLIGSVHFVDGIGIDLNKEILLKYDRDYLYRRYYEIQINLVKSNIFTYLGHPDEIKLLLDKPSFSLVPYYELLAKTLKKHNMLTENNSGLIRYGFPYPGLNDVLLNVFKKFNVKFVKSSDAHVYNDIGRAFDKIDSNI